MRNSIWNTKASDLTVGQSLKYGLICGLLASLPSIALLVYENQDEIRDWVSDKFGRKTAASTSLEEDEDEEEGWGT